MEMMSYLQRWRECLSKGLSADKHPHSFPANRGIRVSAAAQLPHRVSLKAIIDIHALRRTGQ